MKLLSTEHWEIMRHTRDRAAGGFYCGNSREMQDLVGLGLMEFAGYKSFVPDAYFKLTRAGKLALRTGNLPEPATETATRSVQP